MERLISIIVPVYNSKDYLEKSVKSICDQTYSNLEIILIDDGSTDGSGELCDFLAGKDRRIVVMHKENGGQSDARNLGLDNASGDFIGFVDSDDSISPYMYEKLLDNMQKYDAQISCCGTLMLYSDGKKAYFNQDTSLFRVFTKKDAMVEFTNNKVITASLWDKLYRRDVFDGLRLKKGIIYEDFQLIPQCLLKTERVVYTGEALYYYNVTAFSSIRGHRSIKLFDIVPVCAELVELYKRECPEGLPGMENQYIDHCLTLFYAAREYPDWAEKREEILKILYAVNRLTFSHLFPDNKLKLCLLKLNPEAYVRIYEMVQKLKQIKKKYDKCNNPGL